MKILVCVKQVCDNPDTITINESSAWIEYGPATVFRMNRYDEYAVEEAMRIRERFPDTEVHALSLGPARVQSTIRRALGMGVSHGIHIPLDEDRYVSPAERAWIISEAVRGRGYDLIFTGVMAEDDMEAQVGGLISSLLGYSSATGVMAEQLFNEAGEIAVERELEGGRREGLILKLPAVLTIQSGINTPRYPALSHMLKAKAAPLEIIEQSSHIPPDLSGTLRAITEPSLSAKGEFVEGTASMKALKLLDILHGHSFL